MRINLPGSLQSNLESANPVSNARKELNLSRQELADKLNTSLYALVRWERGDVSPPQDVILRLKSLFATNAKLQVEKRGAPPR